MGESVFRSLFWGWRTWISDSSGFSAFWSRFSLWWFNRWYVFSMIFPLLSLLLSRISGFGFGINVLVVPVQLRGSPAISGWLVLSKCNYSVRAYGTVVIYRAGRAELDSGLLSLILRLLPF